VGVNDISVINQKRKIMQFCGGIFPFIFCINSMKPIVTTSVTLLLALIFNLDAAAQKQAIFSVHPSLPRKDISPYIYGTNELYNRATAQRLGGNRMTGYNWENNASNAGVDWLHNSDDYLPWHFGVADSNYEKPAAAIVHYHNQSLASGAYSLITLPMAGYVAKDKNGPVQAGEAAPSARWAYVRNHKNAPFTLNPNKLDDTVYVDEELNFLINKFGPASSATGIKGYSLDNEPCLWSSTHPRLWGSTGVTVQQLMSRSYDLASLVKSMDSTAEVFGPALYGFNAYLNLQSASDWDSIKLTGNYNYFIEYYLSKMNEKGVQAGRRLLDVLDVHWYPETNQTFNARPGSNLNDRNTVAARLEMTRSLWDSTYTENTWIGTWYSGILPLIPKLNQIINNNYPGTKLALSEYSYMGTDHISGAIAQADALGIFGREHIYLATYWGNVENYIKAGFDLYRNYDGAGSGFGDKGVNASTDDNRNTSVYAAYSGSDESRLHLIAINKNQDSSETVTVNVDGTHIYHSARVWLLDNSNATIRKGKNIRVINGNNFQYELPPLTIAHLVLTEEDLSIYPFIDSLTVSSAMGYSDGNAVLQVNATVLDADHNIDSMYINLAGVGGGARTNMVRSGDHYSISFTILVNTPPGMKSITIRVVDSNGHAAEETFPFQIIRKKQPFVIWDGDTKGGGEGFTYYDPSDSNGPSLTIEESVSGGNKQAKSLFMHMGHDHYK
jgi:hypothetical protein